MEIYNENAYDLVDKNNIEKKFEKWDKVLFYNLLLMINRLFFNKMITVLFI